MNWCCWKDLDEQDFEVISATEIVAENFGGIFTSFGVVGKILMSRILWSLFDQIWIQNVGDIFF